jgi:hypothetical protein
VESAPVVSETITKDPCLCGHSKDMHRMVAITKQCMVKSCRCPSYRKDYDPMPPSREPLHEVPQVGDRGAAEEREPLPAEIEQVTIESGIVKIGNARYVRQYFPADAPMVAMIRPHWDEIMECLKLARKTLIEMDGPPWVIKQLTERIGDEE